VLLPRNAIGHDGRFIVAKFHLDHLKIE
jgi:hypothetical protein